MTGTDHLPIYRKSWLLLKELCLVTGNFPKSCKYSLGEEIQERAWEVLDLVLEANYLPDGEKHLKIQELSLAFDRLKVRIRLSGELGIIPQKRLVRLQNELAETGGMIGGWLKWSLKKAGKDSSGP